MLKLDARDFIFYSYLLHCQSYDIFILLRYAVLLWISIVQQ